MKNLAQKDWPSALFLLIIGLGAVVGSASYSMGTLARMGPGYFPRLIGLVLVMMSLLILAVPKSGSQPLQGMLQGRLRPWGCTLIGMLSFVFLGQYGGFIPATFALIFIAALGDKNNSFKTNLTLAVLVTIMTVAIFYYGLRLQFPLFVWG